VLGDHYFNAATPVIEEQLKKAGVRLANVIDRLILPEEEERLFNVAEPSLQALMIAALETSCRVGELLSLQWYGVRFDMNEIRSRRRAAAKIHKPIPKSRSRQRRPERLTLRNCCSEKAYVMAGRQGFFSLDSRNANNDGRFSCKWRQTQRFGAF
jgi:hypothetical protein